MNGFLVPLLMVTATVLPRVVLAGETCSSEAAQRARVYYEDGAKQYRVGELAESVEQFKKAYKLCPSPKLLYNIAQAYRQLKTNDKAIYFYKQYLSATTADDPQRPEVEEFIKSLQKEPAPAPAVQPAPPPAVVPSAAEQSLTASPAPRRAERPIYKKPWFWVVLGGAVAVAGVAVTVAVVETRPTNPAIPAGAMTVRFP